MTTEPTTATPPADPSPAAAPAPVETAAPPAPPAKPDGLPDVFWNAEKGRPIAGAKRFLGDDGALRVDALAKSYLEAEKKLGERPSPPDDYQIMLPDASGTPQPVPADDPLFADVKTWAKKHGLSAEGFSELVTVWTGDWVQRTREQTRQKLLADAGGDAARLDARINALTQRAKAFAAGDEDAFAVLAEAASSAKGVEVVERLLAGVNGYTAVAGATSAAQAQPPATKEALRARIAQKDYQRGDPAARAEVERMSQALAAAEQPSPAPLNPGWRA
jgi:hypothetical protein